MQACMIAMIAAVVGVVCVELVKKVAGPGTTRMSESMRAECDTHDCNSRDGCG